MNYYALVNKKTGEARLAIDDISVLYKYKKDAQYFMKFADKMEGKNIYEIKKIKKIIF